MRQTGCAGQSIAEYATLVGVVAIAMTAMLTYGQRAMQANMANVEEELNAPAEDDAAGSPDDPTPVQLVEGPGVGDELEHPEFGVTEWADDEGPALGAKRD